MRTIAIVTALLHAAIFVVYIAIFLGETAVLSTAFAVFLMPVTLAPLNPLPPINPETAPIAADVANPDQLGVSPSIALFAR